MAASPLSAQDPPSAPAGSSPSRPRSSSAASRRLPPPCWSHEETVALIDAYRDKWYSLRRGNLRAPHWQEVADAVAARCPVTPSKTSVQCRHKMEKLRKRYRAEIQRGFATPGGRYCSSWVHFKNMDSMEKGPSASAPPADLVPVDRDDDEEPDDEEDDLDDFYQNNSRRGAASHTNRNFHGSTSNGIGDGTGVRIRIPGWSNPAPLPPPPPPAAKIYSKFDENPNPNPGSAKGVRDGYIGRFGLQKRAAAGASASASGGAEVGKKREGNPLTEMVAAIKGLGDGFVRIEKMKMEMAREVESMRMEMEMKKTEMILESQQRMLEAFSKGFSEKKNKKVKRMPTPPES